MALKFCAALCAALIMATAFAVPPADARARKDWRYDSWQHQDSWQRYDAQPTRPCTLFAEIFKAPARLWMVGFNL